MFKHAQIQGPVADRMPGKNGKILPDNRVHSSPLQLKSKVKVNDDDSLEREADVMGAKALQLKGNAAPVHHSAAGDVVQRKPIKVIADNLEPNLTEQFNKAYDKFSSTVLAGSELVKNHCDVVLYGVSETTHTKMKDYATTILYIGHDGYKGDEYQHFKEIWNTQLNKELNSDVGIRIVITVNMTANDTKQELYSTLLHEWYAHAVHWEDVIMAIRAGKGKEKVEEVQQKGFKKRAHEEHKEYAGYKKTKMEEMATSMGLKNEKHTSVVDKLDEDTGRYSLNTGYRLAKNRKPKFK